MKKNLDKNTITLLIAATGLSTAAWDIFFNLGAFGVIFFHRIFVIWIISIILFLTSIMLPRGKAPIGKTMAPLMLLPSVWLILKIVDDTRVGGEFIEDVMAVIEVIICLFCLPYIGYIFLNISNPDIFRLQKKLLALLFGVVIIIALAGYILGMHHDLILSCDDFKISGNDRPPNCAETQKSLY